MRLAILGNSGAGKSMLAARLARQHGLAHLDLDALSWEPGRVAVARDRAAARADLDAFCAAHERWVVEGCYAELVAGTLAHGPQLLFLDPGVEACVAHCHARPFEPHKFASRAEQDRHLAPLVEWVRAYDTRDGELGRAAHEALFAAWPGPRRRITSAAEIAALVLHGS